MEHENLAPRPRLLGAEFPLYQPQDILSSEKVKKNNFIFFPKPLDIPIEIAYTIDTVKERRTELWYTLYVIV